MHALRSVSCVAFAAVAIPMVSACHHSPPAEAPMPVASQASSQPSGPSAAELARRDSIARAERDAADRAAREAAERAAAAARATVEAKIFFDYDKSDLRDDAKSTLDRKAPVLTANSAVRIRVEGNTDERGSDEYNIALGTRRAAEAKRYLVEHGVDASRVDVVSNGKEKSVCSDHDESCWQQNRRDEFVITAGGDQMTAPRQ